MYAAPGSPAKSKWLRARKKGNFETWPGLIYSNGAKYCPRAGETIKGHMVKSSQGLRSTKKRMPSPRGINKVTFKASLEEEYEIEDITPPIKTKELHIWDQPISKLYTDDCGRFPIRSRSGNGYIMIAYHCDSYTILQSPFSNRKDKHRIRAYNSIMRCLADRGNQFDVKN